MRISWSEAWNEPNVHVRINDLFFRVVAEKHKYAPWKLYHAELDIELEIQQVQLQRMCADPHVWQRPLPRTFDVELKSVVDDVFTVINKSKIVMTSDLVEGSEWVLVEKVDGGVDDPAGG